MFFVKKIFNQLLFFLLVTCFITSTMNAQTERIWQWNERKLLNQLDKKNTKGKVASIFFQATKPWMGYAVTEEGQIFSTTNEGKSWSVKKVPESIALKQITFASQKKGFIVATKGIIYITNNAGASWEKKIINPDITLYSVCFVDENTGWVVGDQGKIYRTRNGGESWTDESTFITATLRKIVFYNSAIGWAVGDLGTILMTVDAGVTWRFLNTNHANKTIRSIFFLNEFDGVAVGDSGLVLHTTTGGNIWTTLQINSKYTFHDVAFVKNEGYIIGEKGTMLYSNSRGETWNNVSVSSKNLFSLNYNYPKQNKIWIGMDSLQAAHYIYELQPVITSVVPNICEIGGLLKISGKQFGNDKRKGKVWIDTLLVKIAMWRDSIIQVTVPDLYDKPLYDVSIAVGVKKTIVKNSIRIVPSIVQRKTNWENIYLHQKTNFNRVFFLNKQSGWIAADSGRIFYTTDGGKNWKANSILHNVPILDINFVSDTKGFVTTADGKIYMTDNEGESFQEVYSEENRVLSKIKFTNNQTGWVVGSEGTLIKTTTRGETWQRLSSNTSYSFTNIDFINQHLGFAVGYNGVIIKTIDSGKTWSSIPQFTTNRLNDVYITSPEKSWVVGDNGCLARTKNGGVTWEQINLDILENLYSIRFLNDNIGWIVGEKGTILKTDDGGNSWDKEEVITKENLYSIDVISERLGFAVGSNGTLLTHFVQPPEFFSVSPLAVVDNQSITITGENFGIVQEKSVLSLNTTPMEIELWSDTIIHAKIPKDIQGVFRLQMSVRDERIIYSLPIQVQIENETTNQDVLSIIEQRKGGTKRLWDVFFINRNVGWTVGNKGSIYTTSNGGKNWTKVIVGTYEVFTSVTFSSAQNGWIVGSRGVILHTKDGGRSWFRQNARTKNNLSSVQFLNDEVGWIVGEDGTILYTNTGGQMWEQKKFPTQTPFSKIQFVTKKIAWLISVDGSIYKTNDEGTTWKKFYESKTQKLLNLFFFSPIKGYVTGSNGIILYTQDSGKTWQSLQSDTEEQLYAIKFIDEKNGWAVGDRGTIVKTINGGKVWRRLNINVSTNLSSLVFNNKELGWIVGDEETILQYVEPPKVFNLSTNEGYANSRIEIVGESFGTLREGYRLYFDSTEATIISWTPKKIVAIVPYLIPKIYTLFIHYNDRRYETNYTFNIITFKEQGKGWSVVQEERNEQLIEGSCFVTAKIGFAVGADGLILKTIDGGKSWNKTASEEKNILTKIYFTDEDNGWALGVFGTILRTKDAGKTWQRVSSTISETLVDIIFIKSNGWIISKDGRLYLSSDGGENWEVHPDVFGDIQTIYFQDKNNGWIIGSIGKIYYTDDGGFTWHKQTAETNNGLNDIVFGQDELGWAVGDNGAMYKTVNRGDIWIPMESETKERLNDIYFLDEKIGWIAGAEGTLLKTTNSGASWVKLPINTKQNLIHIYFENQLVGNVITDFGEVFHSIDGGATWEFITQSIYDNLSRVFFINDRKGWIVGSGGIILKSIDGGVAWKKTILDREINFRDVYFINDTLGWVCGYEKTNQPILLQTSDGGETWIRKNTPLLSKLNGILFEDDLHGWLISNDENILETTDGGETWQSVLSGNAELEKLFFLTQGKAWAVGKDSSFIEYNSAWMSRHREKTKLTTTIKDIYFANASMGWCIGDSKNERVFINKTIDSGKTWTEQTYKIQRQEFVSKEGIKNDSAQSLFQTKKILKPLQSLAFLTAKDGWIVGNNGTMLHTTTSGEQWEMQPALTQQNLNHIFFLGQNGWAVGDNGIVLKYTDTKLPTIFSITPLRSSYNQILKISGIEFKTKKGTVLIGNQKVAIKSWNNNQIEVLAPKIDSSKLCSIKVVLPTSTDTLTLQRKVFIKEHIDIYQVKSNWVQQKIGATISMNDVNFFDAMRGTIVGNNGAIFHTINGGKFWRRANSETFENLHSILFINNTTGFALGDKGKLFITYNEGVSWIESQLATKQALQEISFSDKNTGWIIGLDGSLFKSLNGGENWKKEPLVLPTNLNSIRFISDKIGFIAGSQGTLFQTIDKGATWTRVKLSTNAFIEKITNHKNSVWLVTATGEIFFSEPTINPTWKNIGRINDTAATSISFADTEYGWVGTMAGKIYATADGGATWKIDSLPVQKPKGIHSIYFFDTQTGWAVGKEGTVYQYVHPKPDYEIFSFAPKVGKPDTIVTIFGKNFGREQGKECLVFIGKEEARVLSWQDTLIKIIIPNIAKGSYFIRIKKRNQTLSSTDDIVILQDEKVYLGNWVNQSAYINHYDPLQKFQIANLNACSFFDELGWAVGEKGTIIKTTNGGNSWNESPVDKNNWRLRLERITLNDVCFINDKRGWIVGNEGTIMKTLTGGEKWIDQSLQQNIKLTAVSFYDGIFGAIVGEKGFIYTTTDAGTHWKKYKYFSSMNCNDVLAIDSKSILVAGTNGIVLKTMNRGKSWFKKDVGIPSDVKSISITKDGHLFLFGATGEVRVSKDTGNTWQSLAFPKDTKIIQGKFLNRNVGFIVAEIQKNISKIFTTLDGGTTWNEKTFFAAIKDVQLSTDKSAIAIGDGASLWKYFPFVEIQNIVPALSDIDDEIYIKGKNFGVEELKVMIGSQPAQLSLWSDSLISVRVPKIPNGSYSILLQGRDFIFTSTQKIKVISNITGEKNFWKQLGIHTTQTITDIKVMNNNYCFATTQRGSIFYSNDSGRTWSESKTKLAGIASLAMITKEKGIAVGANGRIAYTYDGWNTWIDTGLASKNYFSKVVMLDDKNGWIIGGEGTVYRTKNGFENWELAFIFDFQNKHLTDLYFIDTQKGWMIGESGLLLSTNDGGSTWVKEKNITNAWLSKIFFTDKNNGWVVGEQGTIYTTANGGKTWLEDSFGLNQWIGGISFDKKGNGAIITKDLIDNNSIYTTSTFGNYWNKEQHSDEIFSALYFSPTSKFIGGSNGSLFIRSLNPKITGYKIQNKELSVLGEQFESTGNIFVGRNKLDVKSWSENQIVAKYNEAISGRFPLLIETEQGKSVADSILYQPTPIPISGETWSTFQLSTSEKIIGLWSLSNTKNVAITNRGIVFQSTNGETWNKISQIDEDEKLDLWLTAISFSTSEIGWVVGNTGRIYKTTDAGKNWERLKTDTKEWLSCVFSNSDGQIVWVVGGNGIILQTIDGGTTWMKKNIGTKNHLTQILFLDFNLDMGWITGKNGDVWATTNGGTSWAQQKIHSNDWLTALYFHDSYNGWLGTSSGKIYHTNNGGANWLEQTSLHEAWINNITFADTKIGWLSSSSPIDDAKIEKTNTSGNEWYLQQQSNFKIHSLRFFNVTKGMAGGDDGTAWNFVESPEIFSCSPQIVYLGDYINISGNGFGKNQSGSYVKIGRVIAAVHSWEDTLITIVTPELLKGFYPISIYMSTGFQLHSKQLIEVKREQTTADWMVQSVGYFSDLKDVSFVNYSLGIAVGNNGSIVRTENGGVSWQAIQSPIENLNSVQMGSMNVGWIVGNSGLVLKTTNGGKSWTKKITRISSNLNKIFFITDKIGWAVGDLGIIIKSLDGGESWTIVSNTLNEELYSVYFVSKDIGWAVGKSGTILKTINGGLEWERQRLFVTETFHKVFFLNEDVGFVVGNSGAIYKTENGGVSWETKDIKTTIPIRDIFFVDENNGWCIGGSAYEGGVLFKTTNGGEDWKKTSLANNNVLNGFTCISNSSFWIVGNDGLIIKYTIDYKNLHSISAFYPQKNSWKDTVTIRGIGFGYEHVNRSIYIDTVSTTITAWNDSLIKIVVPKMDIGKYKLYVVIDGDTATASKNIIIDLFYFNASSFWKEEGKTMKTSLFNVFFINEKKGWCVGSNGLIMKTIDGKKSWKKYQYEEKKWFTGIFFTNDSLGWIVGEKGTILHTTNGGETWNLQKSLSKEFLTNIFFLNNQLGWIVGGNGTLLKTINGGASWEIEKLKTTEHLQAITFVKAEKESVYLKDKYIGWIVGANGTILRSKDEGKNWMPQNDNLSVQGGNFTSICFNSSNDGWITGWNGVVLHTSDGGVTWRYKNLVYNNKSVENITLRKIQFMNMGTGMILGGDILSKSKIFQTKTNGEIWEQENFEDPLYGMHFINSKFGVAVGTEQHIFSYQNTASFEIFQITPSSGLIGSEIEIRGIGFLKSQKNNHVRLGDFTARVKWWSDSVIKIIVPPVSKGIHNVQVVINGTVSSSTQPYLVEVPDIQKTNLKWMKQKEPTKNLLKSICFIDELVGWLVGSSGTVLKTTDGGASWEQVPFAYNLNLSQVFFTDMSNGWIIGEKGMILKTTDSGNVWQKVFPATKYSTIDFIDCFFMSKTEGYLISANGVLHYYDNGLWRILTPDETNPSLVFNKIFSLDKIIYVVGTNGKAYKITNGTNWTFLNTETNATLRGVYFYNQDIGWMVGGDSFEGGIVLKTYDGGKTWRKKPVPVPLPLTDVFFSDANNGWAVGTGGVVLQSHDGGESWIEINIGTLKNIQKILFRRKDDGWIIGDNGLLCQYTEETKTGFAHIFKYNPQQIFVNSYLTIEGKGLQKIAGKVIIGNESAEIISWSESRIVVKVPNLPVGDYAFKIIVNNHPVFSFSTEPIAIVPTIQSIKTIPQVNQNLLQVVYSDDRYQLKKIKVINNQMAIVVGSVGTILKTTNGGNTWAKLPIKSKQTFENLFFRNATDGWIIGTNGTMFFTNTGGEKWTKISISTKETLRDIVFTGKFSESGWIVGDNGTVISSKDGGITWNKNRITEKNISFTSVYFIHKEYGYIVGKKGEIFMTLDGGDTWKEYAPFASQKNISFDLWDVNFPTSQNGYVVGNQGAFYSTNDGGENWERVPNINHSYDFREIVFTTNNEGWAIGNAIFKTIDNGKTWTQLSKENFELFQSIQFFTNDIGIVLSSAGKIYKLHNTKPTWEKVNLSRKEKFQDVKFYNNYVGWIAGDSIVLRTIDAGKTWSKVLVKDRNIRRLFFNTDLEGWAVGKEGTILKTTDGGKNWKNKRQELESNYEDVYFATRSLGWVADRNKLYSTENGGENWDLQLILPSTIKTIQFINKQHGYIVCENGEIIETENQGKEWRNIQDRPFETNWEYFTRRKLELLQIILSRKIRDNYFADNTNGWAVSSDGKIYYTKDRGKEWNIQFENSSASFEKIYVAKKDNATSLKDYVFWCFGKNSTLYKKNETNQWINKTNPSFENKDIADIFFTTIMEGWLVAIDGKNSQIYYTNDGGETWKEKYKTYKTIVKIYKRMENELIILMDNKTEMLSQNNGDTWQEIGSAIQSKKILSNEFKIKNGFFSTKNKAYAVGEFGEMYMTNDSGKKWKKMDTQIFNSFEQIYFKSENEGYLIGGIVLNNIDQRKNQWGAMIASTIDTGKSWQFSLVEQENKVNRIASTDSVDWAVGDNGLIVKQVKENISQKKIFNQTMFVIEGKNFGEQQPSNQLLYNKQPLLIQSWENNRIQAVYPKTEELTKDVQLTINKKESVVNGITTSLSKSTSIKLRD